MATSVTPGGTAPPRRTLKIVFNGDVRRVVMPEAKSGGPDGLELLVRMAKDIFDLPEKQQRYVRLKCISGSGEPTDINSAKELETAFAEAKNRGRMLKVQVEVAAESSVTEAKRLTKSGSMDDLIQAAIKASAGLAPPTKIEGEGENTKMWLGKVCITGWPTQYLKLAYEFIADEKMMVELRLAIAILAEKLSQGSCFRSSMEAAMKARPKLGGTTLAQKIYEAVAAISKELETVISPTQVGVVLLDTWIDLQPTVQKGGLFTLPPGAIKQMIMDRAKVIATEDDSSKQEKKETESQRHGTSNVSR
uniref:PB1 domain-containing protein n=1 Tax=Lotharella globosa TaxID=91324 RepID=A0A7S4DWQ0_9EUKA